MSGLVSIQHDLTTGRYHPVYFILHPMPGDSEGSTVERYKSKMHHTTGFETEDEARVSMGDLAAKVGATRVEPTYPVLHVGADVMLLSKEAT